MKKLALIAVMAASFTSFNSLAQDSVEEKNGRKNNFATFKSENIASLNKEKLIIDTAISCLNAATATEEATKCNEQKKTSMKAFRQEREAMQQKRMAQRKEHLQEELKKLDEKSAKSASKNATKTAQ